MCLQVEDPQKDRWYAPVLDGKAEKLLIPASERNAIYLFCGTDTKLLVLASGLDVANLDLEDLHEDSRFTQQQKTVLRQYGAIIS